MTKIHFEYVNGSIKKVYSKGHSGYGKEGSDIVCAATSAILQTALLGALKIAPQSIKYTVDEQKALLQIDIEDIIENALNEKINVIFETARLGLEDIASQYDRFVKLEVKE